MLGVAGGSSYVGLRTVKALEKLGVEFEILTTLLKNAEAESFATLAWSR